MARLVFENRFDVPPGYAFAWLTDFRPEDFRALAGKKNGPLVNVTREGARIVREWRRAACATAPRRRPSRPRAGAPPRAP